MSALNKKSKKAEVPALSSLRGPVKITKDKAVTHNGAEGGAYGEKAQLFLIATSSFHGKNQFYRSGEDQNKTVTELARKVAVKDPEWMKRFLPWLRNEANIRTSAITIAIDAAYAMIAAKIPGSRAMIASVLVRADEPGEALAYAMSAYGRHIPKAVKRGIADAAALRYTEFNWLKYDSNSAAVRFADVLELTHPSPNVIGQDRLFKHIIDARHGREIVRDVAFSEALPMIYNNTELRRHMQAGTDSDFINPTTLRLAGMTWEDMLSGSKQPKKRLWEALIPTMGYMALLRNLRNFEEAGIGRDSVVAVQRKLSDPTEVVKSRQLPMRFLSAHRNVVSDTYKDAIAQGLEYSLLNVPSLRGRTLIFVDQSGSMFGGGYWGSRDTGKSELSLSDQARIFGVALAKRAESAKLVQFGSTSYEVHLTRGRNILAEMDRFQGLGGTDTADAIRKHWDDSFDRIFVITDEQTTWGNVFKPVPADRLKISWNLAGYQASHATSSVPNHVSLGGLSDQMFKLVPILEARQRGEWPF
jgi:hypothetical protein